MHWRETERWGKDGGGLSVFTCRLGAVHRPRCRTCGDAEVPIGRNGWDMEPRPSPILDSRCPLKPSTDLPHSVLRTRTLTTRQSVLRSGIDPSSYMRQVQVSTWSFRHSNEPQKSHPCALYTSSSGKGSVDSPRHALRGDSGPGGSELVVADTISPFGKRGSGTNELSNETRREWLMINATFAVEPSMRGVRSYREQPSIDGLCLGLDRHALLSTASDRCTPISLSYSS